MIKTNFLRAATLTAALLLATASAQASGISLSVGDSVLVAEAPVSSWPEYQIANIKAPAIGYPNGVNVYAGVNNLNIKTSSSSPVYDMYGFCIDPFHLSKNSYESYDVVTLSSAPKNNPTLNPPLSSGMGTIKADEIRRLWGYYFADALVNPETAAKLQIAIWEVVSENVTAEIGNPAVTYPAFTYNGTYNIADFIGVAHANFSGPLPNLVALTGDGQDYVVQGVPDAGATLMLAGIALGGVLLFRRNFAA